MRTLYIALQVTLIALTLTACGKTPNVQSLISAAASSQSQTSSEVATFSATSIDMTQRYLYALHDGLVQIIPIDSTTGELIQVVMGNWLVKPVSGAGNFDTMAINANGAMLYVLMRNNATGSKIYQYNIVDATYSMYGSDRPLADTGTIVGTSNPGLFSWANNGNLFLQNFNYTPNRVDSYTPNAITNKLSNATVIGTQTTATVTYALNFGRFTSANFGTHTYVVNALTIDHYISGVFQSSTNIGASSAITDLALK